MDMDNEQTSPSNLVKWPFFASAVFILGFVLYFALNRPPDEPLDQWQLATCVLSSALACILIFLPYLLEKFLELALNPSADREEQLIQKIYFELKELRDDLGKLGVKVEKVPALVDKIVTESAGNDDAAFSEAVKLGGELEALRKEIGERFDGLRKPLEDAAAPQPDVALSTIPDAIDDIRERIEETLTAVQAIKPAKRKASRKKEPEPEEPTPEPEPTPQPELEPQPEPTPEPEPEPEPAETYKAMVRTANPSEISSTGTKATATVLTDGGSEITSFGFMVSERLFFSGSNSGVVEAPGIWNATKTGFHADLSGLAPDKRYYLRAFAVNDKGISLSAPKRFRTNPAGTASPIPGAVAEGNGWYRSSWLGSFYQSKNGWTLHESLGWIYLSGNPPEGIWFWSDDFGWHWISKGVWPYLWSNATQEWLYFLGKRNGQKIFFSFQNGRWQRR